jgi:hypothetical protein
MMFSLKKSLRVVAALQDIAAHGDVFVAHVDAPIWRLRNSSETPSFALYPTSLKNDQASASREALDPKWAEAHN